MKTPKSLSLLIVIAAVSFLIVPVMSVAWYHRIGSSMFLSPDTAADSFGVVVGGLTIIAVVAALVVSILLAIVLRPYPGRVPLSEQAATGFFTTPLAGLAGILALLIVGMLVVLVAEQSLEFVPSALGLLYVSLSVRAASGRLARTVGDSS